MRPTDERILRRDRGAGRSSPGRRAGSCRRDGSRERGEFNVGEDAELLHLRESSDPAQGHVAGTAHRDPLGQERRLVAERKQFAGSGRLAEPASLARETCR